MIFVRDGDFSLSAELVLRLGQKMGATVVIGDVAETHPFLGHKIDRALAEALLAPTPISPAPPPLSRSMNRAERRAARWRR